jgi:NarL family two-component system response regulator LiaR
MTAIRTLLVDDHAVVREGLRLVLGQQPDLEVVGEAADTIEAMTQAEQLRPDVIVMDIALGTQDGVAGIEAILARLPQTRILVLTMFHDAETLRQCLLAGAAGFVVKGAHASDLVDAIRAIDRGERYIHSSVVGLLVEDSLRWLRDGAGLSPREREVLSLLGGGRTPAGIGEALGISIHTVRRHLTNAAAKVGVRGSDGLAGYARDHGFARISEPVRPARR